jgi:hypothetical protein
LALGTARADEPAKKDPSKSDLPLQLRLVAKKATYKLDADSKDLKKQIEDAKKSGRYPAPPKVDLMLEIENRTDKEVGFWVAGDPVQINFQLKGPGAVSVRPPVFFTREFRAPRPMVLAAGKKHAIPVTQLKYGHRGASVYSYWTEPGEYTLTATLSTAISPTPKGVKADQGGFGRVTLTSEPVKIKVEGK